MIAKSHIFSSMRNSVGGITYTANRYSAIVGRARVKPVNVSSNPLELMRTRFNAAVAGWKSLSEAERTAWTNFAKDTPWFNALGDPVSLTGQAMYISQRTAAIAADPSFDESNLDACPCTPGLFPTPLVEFGCCTNPTIGVIVTVTNQDSTNAMNAVVRISPPQSFSRNFYGGGFRHDNQVLLSAIAAGASDDAEFCPECLGRYFFEVRAFDDANNNNMSSLVTGYADACTDPI